MSECITDMKRCSSVILIWLRIHNTFDIQGGHLYRKPRWDTALENPLILESDLDYIDHPARILDRKEGPGSKWQT